MKLSFTFVDQYKKCPFRWYLKYGLKKDEGVGKLVPQNPLLLGKLLHESIELGIEKAERNYYSNFYIAENDHVTEVFKVNEHLRYIKDLLPTGEFEVQINTPEFIGRIDLVSKNKDGTVDIYDFKYTNNPGQYINSWQLHLYKYFYEQMTGIKVRNMYYLIVPKVYVDNKDVTLQRKEIKELIKNKKSYLTKVEYNDNIIYEFDKLVYEMETTKELTKNIGPNCRYCQYESYCRGNKGGVKI